MSRHVAVTVGISTLDRPDAVGRCLDALLEGLVLPVEIIVVDQGTAKPAAAVVHARAGRTVDIRYVAQTRRGLSAARNLMLKEARHPIVLVTDDDCVPDAAWVAGVAAAFERLPLPDAVTGRVLALPGDEAHPHPVSLRTDTRPVDFVGATLPWLVGTGANFAVRTAFLERAGGGYDERLGAGSPGQAAEDLELSWRLLRAGARIRYAPEALIFHERQSEARRLATRFTYGHGIGALAGLLARRRDAHGVTIAATAFRNILRRLAKALRARDRSGCRQAMLSARGVATGMLYGWRIGAAPYARTAGSGDAAQESHAHV